MKATVDREGCIECGLCASVCPEVFRMGANSSRSAGRLSCFGNYSRIIRKSASL